MPRTAYIRYLADHVVPRWADMGARTVTVHSIWVSDYTVDRLKTKEDGGLHGGLVVGSICNVRVHEVDPLWGGIDSLAYFTEKAHAQGMKVEVWWASHLSRRAPIFVEHPEWMMMARDGLANGGGFGHQSLISVDLNAPGCLEWMADKLIAVRRAAGIDGIFHDSYGNMTFLPTNFADPRRRGQQEAYGRLVAKLQQAGMTTIHVEGLGPWGIGHFGMGLVASDLRARARGRYQNALDWWLGEEDMIYGLDMGVGAGVARPGSRGRGVRLPLPGLRRPFRLHEPSGRGGTLDRLAAGLEPHPRRIAPVTGVRTLLPENQGVAWDTPDGGKLLFAFRAFRYAVPGDACGALRPMARWKCRRPAVLWRPSPGRSIGWLEGRTNGRIEIRSTRAGRGSGCHWLCQCSLHGTGGASGTRAGRGSGCHWLCRCSCMALAEPVAPARVRLLPAGPGRPLLTFRGSNRRRRRRSKSCPRCSMLAHPAPLP